MKVPAEGFRCQCSGFRKYVARFIFVPMLCVGTPFRTLCVRRVFSGLSFFVVSIGSWKFI